MASKAAPAMPTRGTPGGHRDPWEEDEAAVVQAELAERGRRLFARVAATRAALADEGEQLAGRGWIGAGPDSDLPGSTSAAAARPGSPLRLHRASTFGP